MEPKENINPKFLFYLLKRMVFEIPDKGYARHFPYLNKEKYPVPPLHTQHRIVEKIEVLFSELDNGVENLKKAQKQLKTYRQAVLKDAFEGRLTAAWRERQDDLPTPEELLQQIKAERNAHRQRELAEWEKEVEQWEKDGKPGRKPSKPRKSKMLEPINDADKHKVPNEWILVKIGHVFDVHVGSTPSRKEPKFWNGDINWVSSGEVSFCQIFDTDEKITNEGLENSSTSVHPPGTIMLGMIGEGKTRGQAAILKTNAAHNQNTAAIRVSDTECSPKFVYHFLFYVYERTRNIGSGNNQKALNKERVRNIIIPFCSAKEQKEMVNEIESRLSVVDPLEQTIKENLQKAEALRQSILKKAFGGKLVKEEIKVKEAEITPFQQMQMIGVLINILKEEYDMAYGEMALAKYMFLIDRIKKYRTGFNFKDWHWGPYDPAIRKRLFCKQYFFRKNKEAYSVIELKENRDQLFKYHLNNQYTLETGVREVAEIISKFKGRKKTSRQLELLATVAKVVENESSTNLQVVRGGMKK